MKETTRPSPLRPRRGLTSILVVFLASGTLSAETPLRVEARLLTAINTYSSKTGAEIRALITTPLCFDGGQVPEGAVLRGSLVSVRRVGLGLVHESASLRPEFHDLQLPDGRAFAVDAHLLSIDNARERIDANGVIHGIRATAALSNRAGERLIFLAMGHPLAVAPLLAVEAGIFHFPDPEIHYRRGTEMYLDVQMPQQWGSVAACPAEPADASDQDMDELRDLVDGLPYWSYSRRQSQPVDLVNLMFVGSSQALAAAFEAAGWTGSRANSFSAGLGAIRAIAQRSPDDGAPMRTLLLDGAKPAFALQKSLNTFEKRHHLRIWQRDGAWRGQPVWASAATQDIGTTFSMRPFGFTHEIQNQVDLERDKVVSDLRYTGCVQSVTYVRRPEPIRESGQEYRRGVTTDARIAVLTLNACEQPRLDLAGGPADPQPSRFVRGFRRVTLTTRNHFIRDNWFWRGFEAARLSYAAIRGWEHERKDERRARDRDSRLLAQQRAATPVVAK
jgi:LssY C-terminus